MGVINEMLTDRALPIWVTGHSLGGALASITGLRLKLLGHLMAPLYTFGAPPAGNAGFCDWLDRAFANRYFRVVIDDDMVPRSLIDTMTWDDVNPKTPLILKPFISLMRQIVGSTKFTQGGRLMNIGAPHKIKGPLTDFPLTV